MTRIVHINEICIDNIGRLLISTEKEYSFIYRTASGVNWDSNSSSLICPEPKEWSYVNWFENAYSAVRYEYGDSIYLSSKTIWTNVPSELRDELLNSNAIIEEKLHAILIEKQEFARDYALKVEYKMLTSKADFYFKIGNFEETVRLLSTCKIPLSKAYEKKLEYSRGKLVITGSVVDEETR